MTDFNPYHPPHADLTESNDPQAFQVELADRGTRLGASLLDGLILMVPIGLILWGSYAFFDLRFWEPRGGIKALFFALGMTVMGSAIFLAVNGRFLIRDGQTLGKKICKIRILKTDGSLPTLWDSFIKRQLVMAFAQDIPILGGFIPLVDALMIFRKSRKCLHDEVAGTMVVKAP